VVEVVHPDKILEYLELLVDLEAEAEEVVQELLPALV